jgi:hypothetical protein
MRRCLKHQISIADVFTIFQLVLQKATIVEKFLFLNKSKFCTLPNQTTLPPPPPFYSSIISIKKVWKTQPKFVLTVADSR